jgi:cellulose 1,4-beta-cellobiosidase
MKGLQYATIVASAISGAFAAPAPAPAPTQAIAERAPAASCATPVTISSNPFKGRKIFANLEYSKEVISAAAQMTGSSASAARKVADVGTFLWM